MKKDLLPNRFLLTLTQISKLWQSVIYVSYTWGEFKIYIFFSRKVKFTHTGGFLSHSEVSFGLLSTCVTQEWFSLMSQTTCGIFFLQEFRQCTLAGPDYYTTSTVLLLLLLWCYFFWNAVLVLVVPAWVPPPLFFLASLFAGLPLTEVSQCFRCCSGFFCDLPLRLSWSNFHPCSMFSLFTVVY